MENLNIKQTTAPTERKDRSYYGYRTYTKNTVDRIWEYAAGEESVRKVLDFCYVYIGK